MKESFEQHIASVHSRLSAVSEQRSEQPYRDGGWLRKEVLGHLIDSALNNHGRFVGATIAGKCEGPGYAQEEWVQMHGYREMTWVALLEHWRLQNELLSRVVARIAPERLTSECRIAGGGPVTLRFMIEDYLRHMDHHAAQILG